MGPLNNTGTNQFQRRYVIHEKKIIATMMAKTHLKNIAPLFIALEFYMVS
jgi:hypothetical protein